MADLQAFTRHYDVPPERLWEALQTAVPQTEAKITDIDEEARRISFSTGILFPFTSWGQSLKAQVSPSDRGGSLLRVSGKPKSRFLSTKWGEDAQAAQWERRLTSALDEALG